MKKVGTVVYTAPDIDALPVGTVVISRGGEVYIQHAPGRWRHGVSGIERWAQALTGFNGVVVTYVPGEGNIRPETELVAEIFETLREIFPAQDNYMLYGNQIQDVLDDTEETIMREVLK